MNIEKERIIFRELNKRTDDLIARIRGQAQEEFRAGVLDAIEHANAHIAALEEQRRTMRQPGEAVEQWAARKRQNP